MARGGSSVTIKILGDPSSAKRAFAEVESSAGGLGSKLAGFGKVAAVGLGAAAAGAGALAKSFVDAAVESQKVTRQTEAVITSMGGASNVTAKQVADLSTSLSMKSGIDDELIQSGENVLLTFGKVRNEVGKGNNIFDRATQSALDMSVALGTDLTSANIQIGKALNDPVKGVTALTKAGVSFTQQQKDQIKTMVRSGDTLGAQKLIMSELEKQFGGSAAAQATAGEKLKVIWGNLQEQLGAKLLPIVEKVATWMADKLPGAFEAAQRIIGPIVETLKSFFSTLFTGLTENDDPTGLEKVALNVRDAVARMKVRALQAFDAIKKWWDDHGPQVLAVVNALKDGIRLALDKIIEAGGFVMGHWDKFRWAAGATAGYVIGRYVAMQIAAGISAVRQAAAWAVLKAEAIASGIVTGRIMLMMIADWVRLKIIAVSNAAQTVGAWVAVKLEAIASGIVTAAAFAAQIAGWIATAVAATANAVIIAAAWFIALGPVAWVIAAVVALAIVIWRNWDKVKGWTSELVQWLKDRWDEVIGFFKAIPGRMAGIFSGMWDGIKTAFRSVINWIIRHWNSLEFTVPGFNVPGIGKVGGATIGVPDIPELAGGGIVKATPGGVLARIGEAGQDEAVIPLNQPGGLIQNHIYLDGREIAAVVTGHQRRQARSQR